VNVPPSRVRTSCPSTEIRHAGKTRKLGRAGRLALLQHQLEPPPQRVFWYIHEIGHRCRLRRRREEHTPSTVLAGRTGRFDAEVVGESLCQQDPETVRGPQTRNSVDSTVQARLSHESGNPQDLHAVRVEIHGRLAG
jgi:hypothetical protein